MAHTDRTPATYAEIAALPEHMVGQIPFGVLHAQRRVTRVPPPAWRREWLPKLPVAACCELATGVDRTDKLHVDAAHGVGHVWLVDPDAKTLEVFILTDGQWLRVGALKDDEPVAAPPFDVCEYNLAIPWADA